MFSKQKTRSKPDKSGLSYTNQGKTMILRRANKGMQSTFLMMVSIAEKDMIHEILQIFPYPIKFCVSCRIRI